jgi:broad specificity phosphatase PhoE
VRGATAPAWPGSRHAAALTPAPEPYPGGESWRQAVTRVGRFLDDLPLRWAGQRVLIIGHMATRWGLDHLICGVPLEDLVTADCAWRPGWEYTLA